MSDRLAELRRQRALLNDHVAWLDREITAELAKLEATPPVGATPRPPASVPTGSVSTASPVTVNAPATIVAPVVAGPAPAKSSRVNPGDADAILDQYRMPSAALKSDVRKGCFLYFAVAMALLIAGIAILWFAFRHH